MSSRDDAIQRECAACAGGVQHYEDDMNCCDKCGKWTCEKFTLDSFEEICDACEQHRIDNYDPSEAELQRMNEGGEYPTLSEQQAFLRSTKR